MSRAIFDRGLSTWLSSHGVDLSRLVIRSFGESVGTGLAAASKLSVGEVALRVPKQVWWPVSAEAARERCHNRDPAVVTRIDALAERLGGSRSLADSTLLAADLALSVKSGRRLEESAKQVEPYLRTLPTTALDVPLLWPDDLRRVLLRGSSCEAASEGQSRLSQALHGALVGTDTPGTDALSVHELRWGQSVLLSRAHAGTGKPFALVPGLDLLNCPGYAPPSASVRFDSAAAAFELVVERPVDAGEQLTIDYGEPKPHRLLRLYGFLPSDDAAGVTGSEHEEAVLQLLGAEGAAQARGALPLRWERAGHVLLPLERAEQHMVHVVGRSLEGQIERQSEGLAGCAAVLAAPGDSAADRTAKQRAALCQRLHEIERPLLHAAARQVASLLAASPQE